MTGTMNQVVRFLLACVLGTSLTYMFVMSTEAGKNNVLPDAFQTILTAYRDNISPPWKNEIPVMVAFCFIYVFDMVFQVLLADNKGRSHAKAGKKLPFPKLTILYGTTTGTA